MVEMFMKSPRGAYLVNHDFFFLDGAGATLRSLFFPSASTSAASPACGLFFIQVSQDERVGNRDDYWSNQLQHIDRRRAFSIGHLTYKDGGCSANCALPIPSAPYINIA